MRRIRIDGPQITAQKVSRMIVHDQFIRVDVGHNGQEIENLDAVGFKEPMQPGVESLSIELLAAGPQERMQDDPNRDLAIAAKRNDRAQLLLMKVPRLFVFKPVGQPVMWRRSLHAGLWALRRRPHSLRGCPPAPGRG